jgi:hypothetical protein
MVSAAVALASPAHADVTGKQSFTVVVRGGLDGDVITGAARGLVNGALVDQPLESQPGDPPNLNRDVMFFRRGTLTILTTFDGGPGPANPASCVAPFELTGTWVIPSGTGAYAGATGSGTFTSHGTVVFQRGEDGCLEDAPPALLVAVFNATGDLTLAQLSQAA